MRLRWSLTDHDGCWRFCFASRWFGRRLRQRRSRPRSDTSRPPTPSRRRPCCCGISIPSRCCTCPRTRCPGRSSTSSTCTITSTMRPVSTNTWIPKRVVEIMNNTNVKTVVILTGMWGDKLQHVIDEMVKPYPGRFIVFTQLDWSKIDDPDFGQEMVRQLDDAVARGRSRAEAAERPGAGCARQDRQADRDRRSADWIRSGASAGAWAFRFRFTPAIRKPSSCPLTASNERYEELTEHPDWSFYGPQYPKLEELLEARNRVFARHPETRFVSLHMGWPENLRLGVAHARRASQRDGGVRSARG